MSNWALGFSEYPRLTYHGPHPWQLGDSAVSNSSGESDRASHPENQLLHSCWALNRPLLTRSSPGEDREMNVWSIFRGVLTSFCQALRHAECWVSCAVVRWCSKEPRGSICSALRNLRWPAKRRTETCSVRGSCCRAPRRASRECFDHTPLPRHYELVSAHICCWGRSQGDMPTWKC